MLNLGRHFEVDQLHWPLLCARVEELLSDQSPLVPVECPAVVERHAQRIAAQLVARGREVTKASSSATDAPGEPEFHAVDVDSISLVRPRTAGVEAAALWAISGCGNTATATWWSAASAGGISTHNGPSPFTMPGVRPCSWRRYSPRMAGRCGSTVTASAGRSGHTLHVRKATRPEGRHLELCQALGIELQPGGVRKLIH